MDHDTPETNAKRRHRFAPRFGLRALLLAILLIAISIPICQIGWQKFVHYREGREYSALQATKDAFVAQQRAEQAKRGGTSAAIDNGRPIPDDYVVLVQRGNSFGCVIPRNQHKKGESLEYEWYYRTDGVAQFNPEDPNVQKGYSSVGPYVPGKGLIKVVFGLFSIEWSGNGAGWGYLYYHNNGDTNPKKRLRICTTNRKTVKYLDGRSAEWIYKSSAKDVGVAGNAIPR